MKKQEITITLEEYLETLKELKLMTEEYYKLLGEYKLLSYAYQQMAQKPVKQKRQIGFIRSEE